MTAQPVETASRVASYYPSSVRAIFAAASRPGIVSFTNGSPDLTLLDLTDLAERTGRVLRDLGTTALQYSQAAGVPALREQIVRLMELEGITSSADRVVVTTGSQFALLLIAQNLVDPGDVVIAESPSYAGGLGVFRSFEAEVRQVHTDAQGLVPAAVDEALRRVRAEGRTCRLVYAIPTFQNPGGTVLPEDRRARLVEVCERHDAYLVEDDAYGLLGFGGQTHRAIKADHPERVFFLGSFSKILSPGLRLGWVEPPAAYRSLVLGSNETGVLNPPTLSQHVVADWLAADRLTAHIGRARTGYAAKAAAAGAALRDHFPAGTTWVDPTGGFYVWVRLPEGIDTAAAVTDALARGAAFVPGTAFYVDGRGHDELRISFSLPGLDDIRRGLALIGSVLGGSNGVLHPEPSA